MIDGFVDGTAEVYGKSPPMFGLIAWDDVSDEYVAIRLGC